MEDMEKEYEVSDDVENDDIDTSEDVEDTELEQPQEEEIVDERPTEEEIQERINNAVESRLARERRKNEDLYRIEDTLKKALGVEDRKEIIKNLGTFYKEQGIDIPNYRSERDEKILAKADAEEIKKLGYEEMEAEANRLASIPERSVREQTIFMELGKALTEQNQIKELKEKGLNADILDNKDFKSFKEKFSSDVGISEIYELYQKVNTKKEKPSSPGSVKSTTTNKDEKEFFTSKELDQLTEKDLDNPKILEKAIKSMSKLGR